MQDDRFRLLRRGQVFYSFDRRLGTRSSLQTHSKAAAERLLRAKNEAVHQPQLNSAIAKVYLAGQDPKLVQRTWQEVMDCYAAKGKPSTQERVKREMAGKPFSLIRKIRLVDTTDTHFVAVLEAGKASTTNYLRRVHNLALKRGWLLQPILPASEWPVWESQAKRAVTSDEHQQILAGENDTERKNFYTMLWEIGSAQSDAADLSRENIDQKNNVLIYHRKKTGEKCQLSIGKSLAELLVNSGVVAGNDEAKSEKKLGRGVIGGLVAGLLCFVLGSGLYTYQQYTVNIKEKVAAAGSPQQLNNADLVLPAHK